MKCKLWEKAICLGLLLTILFTMTGFAGQCEEIGNRVLRLHVLANSDSQEDQALKLKVRDKILECAQPLFEGTTSRDQAEAAAQAYLPQLQQAAQQEIYDQGYDYPVTVELTNVYFNTRQYETVTLPAGKYDAVQVKIGSAQGHNWWCVMFPPMCLPAAEESKELGEVLNSDQMEIVEGGSRYELRFKTVEWLESIKNWFQGGASTPAQGVSQPAQ